MKAFPKVPFHLNGLSLGQQADNLSLGMGSDANLYCKIYLIHYLYTSDHVALILWLQYKYFTHFPTCQPKHKNQASEVFSVRYLIVAV